MEEKIKALENKRKESLDFVEAVYYTPTSVHYRDNERFSYAVKAINKNIDEAIAKLKVT